MKKIFIVCTFSIKPIRKHFISHIPIRIKQILGEEMQVFFLYAGEVEEAALIAHGIIPVRLFLPADSRFFYVRFVMALIRELYQHRPMAMMNMNSHLYNILLGVLGRLFGVRTVARVTGNLFYHQPKSWQGRLYHQLRRGLQFFSLVSMDRILCLSRSLANILPQQPVIQRKIEILSPGIDTNRFANREEVEKDIDLIFVGRMEPIKNLHFAFEVFSELEPLASQVNFHLLGTGSQLASLRAAHSDNPNIVFHGEKPHFETVTYLRRAKFLLLLSHSEGFPNVVLEAMLSKTLVVVTPVSDMEEIVGAKRRGVLVTQKDAKPVAKTIAEYLQNKLQRNEICERAYNYVIQEHNFATLQQRYHKLLFDNVDS